jgi:glycine cleavage system H lipoate-binding protein
MTEKMGKNQKRRFGYGASYRRGSRKDLGKESEIGAVFGGQVWMFKPDKEAKIENPCIWMQAGVVKYKNCNNFYDCNTCKYDLGMMKQVEKDNQISWQDAMRKRPGKGRTCRHSLTHRIESRICGLNYNCSKCDFDQFFEEVWTTKTGSIPYEIQQVKGFDVPMDYFFHNGHTWARVESGGCVRVGLDDFALKLLGKADVFDLPLMGKELDKDSVGWGLRRRNNQADILSPVGGVIVEVNSKVRENPEIANREPYGDGWLFMVRTPDVKKTVKKLMASTESFDWINNEINSLEEMVEEVAGPLAADGGYFQDDIYGNLPGLRWENLTKTFFKT